MGRPNTFDGMMHEFCVKLGYCGTVRDGRPLLVSDFIPETGLVSADQFARWLIAADGLEFAEVNTSEFKRLKEVFVKHMGADAVDANNLRSGY